MKDLMRGAAASLGCAAVGAAAWAGLSLATDMRWALLAIVVGGLAGFGMGVGNRGRGGVGSGLLAAVILCVTVVLSRGVVARVNAERWMRENAVAADQVAFEALAGEVYEGLASRGFEMSDPEGEDEYPPEVMAAARRQWGAMTAAEQQQRTDAAAAQMERDGAAASGVLTAVSFFVDFGVFGWVCLGLGMGTAYKGGSVRAVKTESGWRLAAEVEEEAAQESAPTASGFWRPMPGHGTEPSGGASGAGAEGAKGPRNAA